MTEPIPPFGRGLYFEEMLEGYTLETRGRTITEADLIHFAGVSGDFNPLHTNAEYAKTTQFGARIAHGALVFSVATGLAYQLGILEGTVIAFLGFEMKLRGPVYIGDTIKLTGSVSKRRAMPSAGGGMVTLDVKIINQKGETVQKGEWTIMMMSRPSSQSSTVEASTDSGVA
ncbi:MAG: MaoC/PaaZ C-terminal domain-containing protein [Anaerolineae bacterium]